MAKETCSLNEKEKVRVGIIGPSWWVNFWHLPALQNHPNAEIGAVCGAKERDPAEARAKYGESVRCFTDMEAMLDSVPLDGVIVCTPNDLHAPATLAALRRGLHVLCEKPVALNAAQAREMAETARRNGRIGMTNFPYRGNPAVQTFRRLIAEGNIGTPLHISGVYHGGYGIHRPPGWRGLRERSGAGILSDLGSHLIDLARFVTGDEFASVCAHSLTLLREQEQPNPIPRLVRTEDRRVGPRNEDSCAFLAEFASGAQGLFHTSWTAYQGKMGQYQELEIYGTDGRLHFRATHAGTFLRGLKPETAERWETLPVEGIVLPDTGHVESEDIFRPGRLTPANTTYRWIEAIRTGQSDVSPGLDDGWRAQEVIDAVIQASAERRWVDVGANSS
jgi:predicted dehydrogenase